MRYDFDTLIDRTQTDSLKYDFLAAYKMPPDVLPMWVADMDFASPPEVVNALVARSRHGVYGYTNIKDDYRAAVAGWFDRRFGWRPQPESLTVTPSVVAALSVAIRAFTQPGQAVLVQPPVYPPFFSVVTGNNRRLVLNPLVCDGGSYRIDFDDFERKIIENDVKLFILCSPHNPVGRVWTRQELARMGEICLSHSVLLVSDEIHADFVHTGHTHTVLASISPALAQNSIICTSPSKTFNLAGLQTANIFIQEPDRRRAFRKELRRFGYEEPNIMGATACRAAYDCGEAWLTQLLEYLAGNIATVRSFLQKKLPQVRMTEPQGTYLLWLDFSALRFDDRDLQQLLVQRAGLWLNAGETFGQGGSGFARMNIACPRAQVEKALLRLEQALTEEHTPG